MAKLQLAQDPEADRLLGESPLALLIGMVLDQQIPLEKAFRGPLDLSQRLGRPLDAAAIAAMDPEALAEVFASRPSLHRYPGSMATRVQALCQTIVEEYGGDAAAVWSTASDGQELRRRVQALPGFGEQKARIFVALLGKQLGIDPPGWQAAAEPFGALGTRMSVADIVDAATLAEVRAHKQAMKAAAKTNAKSKAAGSTTSSRPRRAGTP
jgi:uncharacterized HhH-GPD family protein